MRGCNCIKNIEVVSLSTKVKKKKKRKKKFVNKCLYSVLWPSQQFLSLLELISSLFIILHTTGFCNPVSACLSFCLSLCG